MANGSIVPSQGVWRGTFQWNKVKVHTSFEIFDSGGVWSMLIGKPLLEQLGAVHDYNQDAITIPHHLVPVIIHNVYGTPAAPVPKKSKHVNNAASTAQEPVHNNSDHSPLDSFVIVTIPPDSSTNPNSQINDKRSITTTEHYIFNVDPQVSEDQLARHSEHLANAGAHVVQANRRPFVSTVTKQSSVSPCSPVLFTATTTGNETNPSVPVWPILGQTDHPEDANIGEVPEFPMNEAAPSIYSRRTNPFNPARVAEIMRVIKIGDDLSPDQKAQVHGLCEEFADTLALSVSKVYPIDFKTFKLHFPEGTKFRTKVNQRPLTPPQREFLYERLNELEKAGII
ncbi:hypothetical protein EV702DRAFT_1202573 [Suillus placidus]|uniref:Uncharacterized protein n=1 Tax=Suillus placidus TaxID=48579 RepID=A0A9P7CY91_9AGAM|nr:hypothetical protein EV702DRAFT_1202573 [Suillus placidus]